MVNIDLNSVGIITVKSTSLYSFPLFFHPDFEPFDPVYDSHIVLGPYPPFRFPYIFTDYKYFSELALNIYDQSCDVYTGGCSPTYFSCVMHQNPFHFLYYPFQLTDCASSFFSIYIDEVEQEQQQEEQEQKEESLSFSRVVDFILSLK